MNNSVCIFGGSFDPVHKGHKRLADFICERLSPEKMLIIPAAMSPFKNSSGATEEDRLNMCELAFPEKQFEISDIEIKRGGKSYTVDTVSAVKGLFPDKKLYLIIGSDQLLSFNKWYRFADILSFVTLVSVSREGSVSFSLLEEFAQRELRPFGEVEILDFSPLEISSTALREKIALGEDTSQFLDEAVREYIDRKGLYKNV